MADIRTITLEFLRHGPAHNQLLSPLTRYLALCENHSAETVSMPFEHQQLLTRLQSLAYDGSDKTRQLNIDELSQTLAEILQQVPGLIAELCDYQHDDTAISHLQLVLSASELALLPFELANAPRGFSGAGQPLTLQPSLPLCLTRKVRRVGKAHLPWPSKPRILLIAASPPGAGPIPLESHLLALRQIVDPWVWYCDEDDSALCERKVEEHLVFLPEASIESIMAICRAHCFTHIHILAHGAPLEKGEDKRFGLALHDARDPNQMKVVSGVQLANALRTYKNIPEDGFSHPSVVTLASCDSGNVGSVMGVGASIAHDIHAADIPLVIASQFPLTFAGSIIMVQTLYAGLLWGDDPRYVLNDLRQQLNTQVPDSHDWASIVAYAAFPEDLQPQLAAISVEQAVNSLNAAFTHADHAINQDLNVGFDEQDGRVILVKKACKESAYDRAKGLEKALVKLKLGKRRLERLVAQKTDGLALLASVEKRMGQVYYFAAKMEIQPSETEAEHQARQMRYEAASLACLGAAFKWYDTAHQQDPKSSWAGVQCLSLNLVLGKKIADYAQQWEVVWHCVRLDVLTEQNTEWATSGTVAWAHSNMAELLVLALILKAEGISIPSVLTGDLAILDRVKQHIQCIVDDRGQDTFECYATLRQLGRYVSWYAHLSEPIKAVEASIKEVLTKFTPGDWRYMRETDA